MKNDQWSVFSGQWSRVIVYAHGHPERSEGSLSTYKWKEIPRQKAPLNVMFFVSFPLKKAMLDWTSLRTSLHVA